MYCRKTARGVKGVARVSERSGCRKKRGREKQPCKLMPNVEATSRNLSFGETLRWKCQPGRVAAAPPPLGGRPLAAPDLASQVWVGG